MKESCDVSRYKNAIDVLLQVACGTFWWYESSMNDKILKRKQALPDDQFASVPVADLVDNILGFRPRHFFYS